MKRFLHPRSTPYAVLLLGLLLTTIVSVAVSQAEATRDRLRFENQTQQTQDTITSRLDTYIAVLRGGSGLLAANPDTTSDQFEAFVDRLNLATNFPGIQGIGVARRVSSAERESFITTLQQQGRADFRIWPDGSRPEYYPITFLEPPDQRNQAAIGYDMFAEPTRRAAMEQARDTGVATMSSKVMLVQEIDDQKQAGFLIYVPIYRGGVVPPTVEERRETLLGFIYSPFRVDDLLTGVFGSQTRPRISFRLYDGTTPNPAALLHQSQRDGDPPGYTPELTAVSHMTIANHEWTIEYATRPAFTFSNPRHWVPLVLLLGIGISAVLFVVSRAQVRARTTAETTAAQLLRSEEQRSLLLEREQAARAEAEAAVQMRDMFFSVASHELRTPLTTLMGQAQLLERRAQRTGSLSDRDLRSVQVMSERAARLNELIGQMLDMSRLQLGQLSIDHKPVDLGTLVEAVIDDVQPTLMNHTITYSGPDAPVVVDGDQLRLEQVIANLVQNAIKYSPDGGPIEVRVTQHDEQAIVQVSDQGIGIPADALPGLFQRFYRATNAHAINISGLGIGLYVVREIVALHGGSVAVESTEGIGSTFTVALRGRKDEG